jgi:dihydroorotate dehydrogenase
VIGFNIGKNKDTPNENAADDYLACLRKAYPVAGYIAVNLSSPNTPGLRDLQGADASARLLEVLKTEQSKLAADHGRHVPLLFKVAPDLDDDHIRALADGDGSCGFRFIKILSHLIPIILTLKLEHNFENRLQK